MANLGFLLLGIDSLIACIAVGAVLGKKARLPFAVSFGIGDAGGFLIGSAFHWSMPDGTATVVETAVLVALGVYWIVLALATKQLSGTRWVWVLPWVLSIDNITYGLIDHSWTTSLWGQAAEQFVSSALMAGIGVAISIAAVRAVPALRRLFADTGASAGGGVADSGGAVLASRAGSGTLAGVVGGSTLIVLAAVLLAVG